MEHNQYIREVAALKASNLRKEVAIVVLALSLLASIAATYSLMGSERTVVTPPNIDRTFWVTRDKASKEYLEQMASYVSYLLLDADPKSTVWKRDQLLAWADPSHYQDLKAQIEAESERLRTSNATTSFTLQSMVADEATQRVRLDGNLQMRVNGSLVTEGRRSYIAAFAFKGGRMHLQTYKEIVNGATNPVKVGSAAGAAAQ